MSKTILVERDVAVPMRDGVTLRADVYRPDTPEPLPLLLQRTMYGKGFSQVGYALLAAERGYAVVIQDTRGRWASEGENSPFIHEKDDGYDTVEWAAHQPWSNGRVGMFGGSYVGYTQLAAASAQPPSLKTIAPAITFTDPYSSAYTGGALTLGEQVAWVLLALSLMDIQRLPIPNEQKLPLWGQFIALVDGMSSRQTFDRLPLSSLPLIGQDGLTSSLSTALAHPTEDDLWRLIACPYDRINVPAYHWGGWYDPFLGNTLRDYAGIREQGNPSQKLMIGPWTHGSFDNAVGEADFGIQASAILVLPDELHLRWFDYWLKGVQNGFLDEPPIRIFVMGDNVWRSENEWPLARTRYTSYYLHSSGTANSLHGDGGLSLIPPANEPPDHYTYDPRNPVPTRGGALLGWQAALPAGVYDQRTLEERHDVLVYTTPPLEQDLEVTGPLQVNLWAASDAPDTDFTAKLVDVDPSGYARNLQDGILRARFRRPGVLAAPLVPGEPTSYSIDLAATSNVFKAGHRIRLEVSSSNFPRFDRNPNTGGLSADSAELRLARQTVLHDSAHPSQLVLPVIPRPD